MILDFFTLVTTLCTTGVRFKGFPRLTWRKSVGGKVESEPVSPDVVSVWTSDRYGGTIWFSSRVSGG